MDIDVANLTEIRRDFHRFPELVFKEERTKTRVAELLRDFGMEVHLGVGVVGVLKVGTGNRAIGLRADMDALPIPEESQHGYSSEAPGVMHACGHDGHMTMLLGAAQALVENPEFDGTVVFIFQPNEEHAIWNTKVRSSLPLSKVLLRIRRVFIQDWHVSF